MADESTCTWGEPGWDDLRCVGPPEDGIICRTRFACRICNEWPTPTTPLYRCTLCGELYCAECEGYLTYTPIGALPDDDNLRLCTVDSAKKITHLYLTIHIQCPRDTLTMAVESTVE